MKRFLLFLLLVLSFDTRAQKFTSQSYATALGDMKAEAGTNGVLVSVNGLSVVGDDNPGFYRWDANSVLTDDGFKIISVNGVSPGRWMRVGNSNTIKGTTTLSGTLLITSYFVGFGITLPFVPITVVYTPRTQAASQPSWIPLTGGITNLGFTISYQTVPIIGTQNMVIDWIAFKQ